MRYLYQRFLFAESYSCDKNNFGLGMKKMLLFSLNLILIIEAFERGFPGGNLHPGLEGRGSGSQEDPNNSRIIPYIQLNFLINLLQL